LEDGGKVRKIIATGGQWRSRHYVGPWMTGLVGTQVRLR
jgi:hypothetical protein